MNQVQSSRFKVQSSRFKVQGSKFKVQGSKSKAQVPGHYPPSQAAWNLEQLGTWNLEPGT
jgi:hypothetical protein